METFHLIAGARAGLALVQGDGERRALLARLAAALGPRLLAYCVMDTHVHAVAEGRRADLTADVEGALVQHTRDVNRRRGLEGRLLRGPVEALPAPSAVELARMIRYVHENPLKTSRPLVGRALEYRWSSQRAFSGLSRAEIANVTRARELLGAHARRTVGAPTELADLAQAAVPGAGPSLILAAAAEVFGIAPEAAAGPDRAPGPTAARVVFLRLGQLESYAVRRLAPFIGRSQPQASRLAARPVDPAALRAARTLLRDPEIRTRLPGVDSTPGARAHAWEVCTQTALVDREAVG